MQNRLKIPRYGTNNIVGKSILSIFGSRQIHNNSSKILYFSSGSSALCYYLKSLQLPSDCTVGVPLYTCSSVLDAITTAGYKIGFVDLILDNNGYNFSLATFEDFDVLIIIHYFGIKLNKIPEIRRKYPKLFIIEDCSHVHYGLEGQNFSSDAQIFSFNFHKPLSAGSGGGLVVNSANLYEFLSIAYSKIPEFSKTEIVAKIFSILIRDIAHLRIIQKFIYGIISKRRLRSAITLSSNEIVIKKILRFSLRIINKYCLKRPIESNKKSYLLINPNNRLNITEPESNDLLYFPVFCNNETHKKHIAEEFEKLGIDSFVLWENFYFNSLGYNSNISPLSHPRTFKFISSVIFLPEMLFNDLALNKSLREIINIINSNGEI